MLVIPAIDLKDGQCVRLRQGRMEDSTVFSDDPVEMAVHWLERGAKRLHIVDLNGAFEGTPVNAEIVTAIAKTCPRLPIQIGGGIRNLESVRFYIEAGVSFVIIGTAAVKDPDFVKQACEAFPKKIIVGLDAIASISFAKLREEEKAIRFTIIKLLGIITNIALNLYFIIYKGLGIEYVFDNFPLNISLDWKPELDIIRVTRDNHHMNSTYTRKKHLSVNSVINEGLFIRDISLSIRYII